MSEYQPSEAEWEFYGMVYASTTFTIAIMGGVQLALQLLMSLYIASAALKAPRDRLKGMRPFLACNGIILGVSATAAILTIWQMFRRLFKGGPSGQAYITAFRADLQEHAAMARLSMLMADISCAGSDFVMLWRCFILWKDKKWVAFVPFLALIGSIAFAVLSQVRLRATGYTIGGPVAESVAATVGLSVATNIMVTALILYKLFSTSLEVSKVLPHSKPYRMYWGVAAAIVESAAPVAFFGTCYATVLGVSYYHPPQRFHAKGALNSLFEVLSTIYYASVALSPQIILLRVVTGRSWRNAAESRGRSDPMTSSPIRFATIPEPTSSSA